jgi:hypothetical protein
MQKIPAFFFFLLFAFAVLLTAPVSGASQENVIVYQTDFSTDPGWITNNPSYYYWDVAAGNYHFETEGGTNGFSYVPVDYTSGPFTLEYDLHISSMKPESSVRFGITGSEMDISKGTVVLADFDDNTYGKIMSLRVVDPNNHLHEISSRSESYCGDQPNCETKEFAENITYHVTVRYNDQVNQADIKITEKETGNLVWGYFVGLSNDLYSLNRLAITTKGDYLVGNTATGWIDNVVLSTYRPAPPTTETTIPTTLPTTAPPTTIPTSTPTPTKSGGGSMVVICTIAAAAGIGAWRARREI